VFIFFGKVQKRKQNLITLFDRVGHVSWINRQSGRAKPLIFIRSFDFFLERCVTFSMRLGFIE